MQEFPYPDTSEFHRIAERRSAFLAGGKAALTGVRPDLLEAWARSQAAGVSPARDHVPLLLEGGPLHDYTAGQEVYRTGRPVLETAADLLEGTGHGLILSDAQGMVLHLAGDRGLTAAAERIGSLPGASWREDIAGNNAIGTALATGSTAEFHFHEHWCAGWGDWICAAAPVRETETGVTLGAISLCAHRRTPEPGMLTMAVRLAGTLERELGRQTRDRHAQLEAEAIKLRRWFPGQGVLAIDYNGRVVWSGGALPPGLLEALADHPLSLLPAKLRGEREILVTGRYPCLVVPVWDESDWRGHLLITSEPPDRAPRGGRAANPVQRIVAGNGERRLVFTPEQIHAARMTGGRIWVITDSGEWPTSYESMKEVQERLPESGFFQADRGCLVNLARVKEIHPMFNRTVNLVLSDRKGTAIPVSRRRTAALRELIDF